MSGRTKEAILIIELNNPDSHTVETGDIVTPTQRVRDRLKRRNRLS